MVRASRFCQQVVLMGFMTLPQLVVKPEPAAQVTSPGSAKRLGIGSEVILART